LKSELLFTINSGFKQSKTNPNQKDNNNKNNAIKLNGTEMKVS
jgi:hypothetical protein